MLHTTNATKYYNIFELREFYRQNCIHILNNLVKYISHKGNINVECDISTNISTMSNTGAFMDGHVLTLKYKNQLCKIFIPIPVLGDYYIYRGFQRVLQNELADDIWTIQSNNILRYSPFFERKDLNSFVDDAKLVLSLLLQSANYSLYYFPHMFALTKSFFEMPAMQDLLKKHKYVFREFVVNSVSGASSGTTIYLCVHPAITDVSLLDDNEDYLEKPISIVLDNCRSDKRFTTNIKVSANFLNYENYVLARSLLDLDNESLYVDPNPKIFRMNFTKAISFTSASFLHMMCRVMRMDNNGVLEFPSSLYYKVVRSYQQIYSQAEVIISNNLRKLAKISDRNSESTSNKVYEAPNLTNIVARLSTFKFEEIYNPFTEIRLRGQASLSFKDISDQHRQIDKTHYGRVCLLDTQDKDPGKTLNVTYSAQLDVSGRFQYRRRREQVVPLSNPDNATSFQYMPETIERYKLAKDLVDNLIKLRKHISDFDYEIPDCFIQKNWV